MTSFLSLLVRRSRSSRKPASDREDRGAASSTSPSVVAEQPWRSCVCAIESDARDGLNLVNVCPILN